jgi:UDP-N-acetylmuramyl pentapeptide synthase
LEKLKLFVHSDLLIHNYDQLLDYKTDLPQIITFTWSFNFKEADLYVFSQTVISKRFYLRAMFRGNEVECLIPFLDEASVENAVVCWATLLAMGYQAADVDERLR